MKFYPIHEERHFRHNLMAIKINEYCKPQKGEWFISGAIPGAYLAQNDLNQCYQICKLVKTKTIRVID